MRTLYIVVPCYNEEEVLAETSKRLLEKIKNLISDKKINDESRIVFVDDGSKDRTWELIMEYHKKSKYFSGIKLSRNKGHQNALLAGLMTAKDLCDVCISMDADLQDDINAIDGFLEKHEQGCDVVYGVRSARKKDTFFKRSTALGFYKFMKTLGVDIVNNHADYRLLSKRALETLSKFKEVNLFLRGLVPLIGFKSDVVMYERSERFAGESKYPLKKMLAFAFDGVTSFSVKPIRAIFGIGVITFAISVIVLIYSLISKFFFTGTMPGWTTIMLSIWMLGGVQLLCVGLIGEYIGKIYGEVKQRPSYVIEAFINETGN